MCPLMWPPPVAYAQQVMRLLVAQVPKLPHVCVTPSTHPGYLPTYLGTYLGASPKFNWVWGSFELQTRLLNRCTCSTRRSLFHSYLSHIITLYDSTCSQALLANRESIQKTLRRQRSMEVATERHFYHHDVESEVCAKRELELKLKLSGPGSGLVWSGLD